MDCNNVVIGGRLTRDPEIRVVGDKSVANFSLALNRVWKNAKGEKQEEVTFIDCEAWSPQAELLEKFTHKGDSLLVVGRLKSESWPDKKHEGETKTRLKIVADRISFGAKRADKPAEPTHTPEGGLETVEKKVGSPTW